MSEHAKRNAAYTVFAGLILLAYGWLHSFQGISDDAFHSATLHVFTWTLRIGGAALVLVAVVCYLGGHVGLLLDAIISILCGVAMGFCGVYWIITDGFNLQYALYVLFGLIFAKASWASFRSYLSSPTADGSEPPAADAEAAADRTPPDPTDADQAKPS